MPVSRIDFGEVRDSTKVDLFDSKSGFFESHPLNPPTNTLFLAHFVTKRLADLGWCIAPRHLLAMDLGIIKYQLPFCNFYTVIFLYGWKNS